MKSVSVIAQLVNETEALNSRAISVSTSTSRKKSNASSVQPRKLAATTCFCSVVQPFNAANAISMPLQRSDVHVNKTVMTRKCGPPRLTEPPRLAIRAGLLIAEWLQLGGPHLRVMTQLALRNQFRFGLRRHFLARNTLRQFDEFEAVP